MRRAQGCSSAAAAGWQMKIRRRLSVSPTPVTLNGPETSNPGMRRKSLHFWQLGDRLATVNPTRRRSAHEGDAHTVRPALTLT